MCYTSASALGYGCNLKIVTKGLFYDFANTFDNVHTKGPSIYYVCSLVGGRVVKAVIYEFLFTIALELISCTKCAEL